MQYLHAFLLVTLLSVCTALSGCATAADIDDYTGREIRASDAETININIAGADELRRIPHVGDSLAAAIIEHRERHGAFSRPEHLMLVQGIGDARFRKIRHLIRTE